MSGTWQRALSVQVAKWFILQPSGGHMSYSLNSLRGGGGLYREYVGTIIGVIKGVILGV